MPIDHLPGCLGDRGQVSLSCSGCHPLHVGFTGGRRPATQHQEMWIRTTFERLFVPGAVLHHGDCVGKDEVAHRIAQSIGYMTVVHPPTISYLRAFCMGVDVRREPRPYLIRNEDIVRETSVLVAVPDSPGHKRSGTWYTVRFANRVEHDVIVCPYYRGVPAAQPLHEQ